MKIACIGDIHGNLHALQAVLADAARRGATTVWNVGDSVGYGACPDQVITRLRKGDITNLQGNYDRKTLMVRKKRAKWSETKKPEKLLAFQWAHDHLSGNNRKWLADLPRELHLEQAGMRILLTHTCENAQRQPIAEDTPLHELEELAKKLDVDVVVFGHTHRPFAMRSADCVFVNTGSVGRPEGDPRASYALLNLGSGAPKAEHILLEYNVEDAVNAIRLADLPEEFAQMLYWGIDFDEARRQRFASVAHLGSGKTEALEAAETMTLHIDPSEADHARQVARLSLRIFDDLESLHGLGTTERFWLHLAALLHDIGWSQGGRAHHKASADMIMDSQELPFGARRRLMVANIARYHRKALPSDKHPLFATLNGDDQQRVRILAGLLRVADALDLRHRELVRDLECKATAKTLRLTCQASAPMAGENQQVHKKADLIELIFGLGIRLQWKEFGGAQAQAAKPRGPHYNHLRQIPLWARAGTMHDPNGHKRQVDREADIRKRQGKRPKKK